MKISKEQLKQIIKEELAQMSETTSDDATLDAKLLEIVGLIQDDQWKNRKEDLAMAMEAALPYLRPKE
tara:strand:+ start:259 stop:462 length:204 start_codon:yes stop_codon:yes gene_type:complete